MPIFYIAAMITLALLGWGVSIKEQYASTHDDSALLALQSTTTPNATSTLVDPTIDTETDSTPILNTPTNTPALGTTDTRTITPKTQSRERRADDDEEEDEDEEDDDTPTTRTTTPQPTKPAPSTPTTPSTTNTGTTCGTGGACTRAQVATHNTEGNCYVYLTANNRVYNITKYVSGGSPNHPGGDVITPYCGKDITDAFLGSAGGHRHSSRALNTVLQAYDIGALQ